MTLLIRAPKECGSWFWDLEGVVPTGLESSLTIAARMTKTLKRFDLLTPTFIEYKWYVRGSGYTGVTTRLSVFESLEDPELTKKVLGSRPVAFPDAEIGSFDVIGSGTWIGADGAARREPQLVDLSVTTADYGPTATLSVHHDIWSAYDFFGRLHRDVQRRNAPRLADTLQELSSIFGVLPDAGEPTYFGAAVEFGIGDPDADENGFGPDVSDRL